MSTLQDEVKTSLDNFEFKDVTTISNNQATTLHRIPSNPNLMVDIDINNTTGNSIINTIKQENISPLYESAKTYNNNYNADRVKCDRCRKFCSIYDEHVCSMTYTPKVYVQHNAVTTYALPDIQQQTGSSRPSATHYTKKCYMHKNGKIDMGTLRSCPLCKVMPIAKYAK